MMLFMSTCALIWQALEESLLLPLRRPELYAEVMKGTRKRNQATLTLPSR